MAEWFGSQTASYSKNQSLIIHQIFRFSGTKSGYLSDTAATTTWLARDSNKYLKTIILELIEKSGDQITLGAPSFDVASIPPLDINLQKSE